MSQFYSSVKRRAALSKRLTQLQGKLKFAVRRGIKKLVIDTVFEIHSIECKIEALDAVRSQNVQTHHQSSQPTLKTREEPTGFTVYSEQLVPLFGKHCLIAEKPASDNTFTVHTDQLIPTFVESSDGSMPSGTKIDTFTAHDGQLKKMEEIEEQPLPYVKGLTGRVNRWGKWVDATAIGWCEYGTRYLVEFKHPNGDIGKMFVFPKKFYLDSNVQSA